MRKYISIVLVLTLCIMSLTACGEDSSANTTPESNVENTVQESNSQDSEHASDALPDDSQATVAVNDSGNTIPDGLIGIYVRDGKHADFVFHGVEGIASVDIYIDDSYSVFIWDSGSEYQAGIQKKEDNSIKVVESSAFDIINDDIVIHADATSVSDIDFANISGVLEMNYCTTDDEYSFYEYKWDAVAQTGEYNSEVASDTGSNANGSTTNSGDAGNAGSSASAEDILANGVGKYTASNGDYIEVTKRSDGTYYLKINLISSRSDMATDTFNLSNATNNSNGTLSYSNYTEFGFDCQVTIGNNKIDLNMGGDANFSALNESFAK
ncbi:MAG: hypothetical protein IJ796_01630 [Lachnospiraceae bacterium]|nr:hypothetical protein [Lachnospiraceae bacterium]